MTDYHRPAYLPDALALLAERPVILAGGTDVFPARANGAAWLRPDERPLLDLGALPGLRSIETYADHTRIGALVTWSDLRAATLPAWFDGLRAAAGQIGGVQIQNRATLVGNLCNASPAADGVPPLLSLDATLELASVRGTRRVALADFLRGPRQTALAPDELAVALLVPHAAAGARAGFAKLGARHYLVISIAMVAAVIELAEGQVATARIAVGACSAVAQRLPALEAALAGTAWRTGIGALVRAEHFAGLAPIDDVRASAGYRRDTAVVLVRRHLEELALPAQERAA